MKYFEKILNYQVIILRRKTQVKEQFRTVYYILIKKYYVRMWNAIKIYIIWN